MIKIPDDISREDAIKAARILTKALEHARAENRQLRHEYAELMQYVIDVGKSLVVVGQSPKGD